MRRCAGEKTSSIECLDRVGGISEGRGDAFPLRRAQLRRAQLRRLGYLLAHARARLRDTGHHATEVARVHRRLHGGAPI